MEYFDGGLLHGYETGGIKEIEPEVEYEIHYGYHGVHSAHYTLCGIKSISFAKKKLDEFLGQPGWEYAYIIKIEKTKLL